MGRTRRAHHPARDGLLAAVCHDRRRQGLAAREPVAVPTALTAALRHHLLDEGRMHLLARPGAVVLGMPAPILTRRGGTVLLCAVVHQRVVGKTAAHPHTIRDRPRPDGDPDKIACLPHLVEDLEAHPTHDRRAHRLGVRHAAAGWMRSTGQAEAASLARRAPTRQSADGTATASRDRRRRRRREDGGVR